jgi:hypothetical protein
MTTLNPCCAVIVPTQRPLAERWLDDVKTQVGLAWRRWNEVRRLHAEQRALEGLSDSTLRDIGMAERGYRSPTLQGLDWERGRWQ